MFDISGLQYSGVPIMFLNIGVVEGLKRLGLASKFAGLSAIGMGLLEGIFLFSDGDIKKGIVLGLAVGLSSVGLFSTGNTLLPSPEDNKEE